LKSAKLLTLMMIGLAAGCGAKDSSDTPSMDVWYIFNVACSNWRVEAEINGQPIITEREGISTLQGITTFVVDGRNTIHVTADRLDPDYAFRDCDIRVGRSPWDAESEEDYESLGRLYDDGSSDQDHFETTFEFTADIPFRWTWQDADDLGELRAEDRKAILEKFGHIADAHRAKDWETLKSSQVFAWDTDVPPPGVMCPPDLAIHELMKEEGRISTVIGNYEDYTVKVAPADSIRFAAGSKIVRIFVEEGDLIYAGHSEDFEAPHGEVVYSLGPGSSMYFIRQKGSWHWMR